MPSLQGWTMSSALVGCIFGAVLSGFVADRFGRKMPLILSAALFTISAFGTGYVDNFTLFIIYRLIGGLGIGLASTLSPMYIAEIAPAKYRGHFGCPSCQLLNRRSYPQWQYSRGHIKLLEWANRLALDVLGRAYPRNCIFCSNVHSSKKS